MDDEFVPKKISEQSEEMKVEPKIETQEEVKRELPEPEKNSRKGSVGRVISRIISTLFFLFVLFEVVIGLLDMQKINEGKKPVWCFSEKTEKLSNKTETTCDLGLYVIVKTVEGGNKTTVLKPFFLK